MDEEDEYLKEREARLKRLPKSIRKKIELGWTKMRDESKFEPLTKFAREKIKKTRFEDRGYIQNLLFLEYCIAGGEFGGFAGGIAMGQRYDDLEESYPAEALAIAKELDPEEYEAMLQERKKKERWERGRMA